MIKKYPFVKQHGLKDCAAASTLMIIKYYKGNIGMNKLNEMLKTTRNGTTAYHIIKVLKTFGFEAYGIKGKFEQLKNHPRPFIASVIINNSYKHFIVVYEINDNYLLIADPAKKIEKVLVENFKQIWTGISLHMYPIKPIIKMEGVQIKKFLRELIISNKRYLFTIFLLSLLITFFSIYASFFLPIIIDNIKYNNLTKLFYIYFSLIILKIILDFTRNQALIILNKKIDRDLTNKIFKDIIYLPYNYYHGKTTGEILSRINDLGYVRNLINTLALSLFIDLPLSLITMIILLYLNINLFIIVLFTFIFYFLIIFIFKNKLRELVFDEGLEKSRVSSYMTEVIKGFETIKGLGVEYKINSNFKEKYEKKLSSSYKLDKFYNFIYLLKELINNIGQIILIFVGIRLVQKQMLSLGEFLTYLILTSYFLSSVRNIVNLDLELKEAKEALTRILDLTYFKEKTNLINKKVNFDIVINHLNYSYDDINLVLKNINLKIKQGEKILITGQSGSGKSTLLKIIKSFYKVKGKVKLGGTDISKLSEKIINQNIVYVGQNEILFTGSLLENLTLRGSNYKTAMQISSAEDIIKKDHLGYYMLIEEDGFNLSGGQKQRIALARALENFNIILIDEGLSGVDSNMERKILKNIFSSFPNKTVIVISHRLDNLDLFERYIKMHSGQIILDEKRR